MFDPSKNAAEDRSDRAHALLDRLLSIDPKTAPGAVLSEGIEAAAELKNLIDGAVVGLLPQWEASGDWSNDGSRTAVSWLVNHTGMRRTTAGAVRKTAMLAASMPHVATAAAAGSLPLTHLGQLARARTDEVAEVFDRDEAALVETAHTLTSDALTVHLLAWRYQALEELQRNDPDNKPDTNTDDDTIRLSTGFAGRGILDGDLTPESTAILREAIEARIETWRRTGALQDDDRTYQELAAAALMDIVADGSTTSRRGQPRPLLIALATLTALFDQAAVPTNERDAWRAEILGGGPIAKASLRRLMEQANLVLVITDDDGEPLHVGRAQRLATAAMLRALIARSGGRCEHPGCDTIHNRCHAHHIAYWENGGETELPNLALLCPHHHRLIHKRGFTLTRGPTGLEFRTPDGRRIEDPRYQPAA